MFDYLNISTFFIGFSTAFFSIFAIHILCFRRCRTRYQTILGIVMAVWAVSNIKDLVITFPGFYTERVLNWIMIIDGWSALTYTILVLEVVMPGWTTMKRLLLLSMPFAIFTVIYAFCPTKEVILAYCIFLWCYAWTVIAIGYVKAKRHISYVRSNYSNIDDIDVSWLRPVFIFAIVSQLSWLLTSLCATVAADILYYVSTLVLWLMVLKYSWNFRPVAISGQEHSRPQQPQSVLPFAAGTLESLVEQQSLYLNADLTLQDLATMMHTNRTYLSQYLRDNVGQTFYDYINRLRIEKKSIPMMREHPEYTLEYVALQSGFGSISTFRRAFQKFTGMSPSQFSSQFTVLR